MSILDSLTNAISGLKPSGGEFLSSDLKVRGGQIVIKGTRFPLARLLIELSVGYSIEEIAEDYGYPVEILRGALEELASKLWD